MKLVLISTFLEYDIGFPNSQKFSGDRGVLGTYVPTCHLPKASFWGGGGGKSRKILMTKLLSIVEDYKVLVLVF